MCVILLFYYKTASAIFLIEVLSRKIKDLKAQNFHIYIEKETTVVTDVLYIKHNFTV